MFSGVIVGCGVGLLLGMLSEGLTMAFVTTPYNSGDSIPFNVELLDEVCMPERAHETDACYDLKARCIVIPGGEIEYADVAPGDILLVPAGFKIELSPGWEAQIRPRSGLALKHGITVLNSPGTVDADYRGEVGVVLHNAGKVPFRIGRGDRIAQMAIRKYDCVELVVKDGPLGDTERGDGGFGSSGV